MAYEYIKSITYGVNFLGDYPLSKEQFLNNPKGRKYIEMLIKKASELDIFSQGKVIEDYLYERLYLAIEYLCQQKQWSRNDVDIIKNNANQEIIVNYETTYDGYKMLNNLSNIEVDSIYPHKEFRALYIADCIKENNIKHISSYEINEFKSNLLFSGIDDFMQTHEFKITSEISRFPLIEYIIALYAIGVSVVVSIAKDSSLVFYTKAKYLDILNHGAIGYSLDNILNFLIVDSLRDEIEQIEKCFYKGKLSFSNRNDKFYHDFIECINQLPYGEAYVQVHDGYPQMMEYKFKSSDNSQSNFKKIQDFIFGRGTIGYEYHQGIKKNIIGSKKFNYKKQLKQERIANDE